MILPRSQAGDLPLGLCLTCAELLNMSPDEAGTIMVWVHGYFGGMANDTKVDLIGFRHDAEAVGDYCAEHKRVTLLSAVKDIAN